MGPMGALGRNDGDLLVLHADGVQFLYDNRQHDIRMDQAGNIADDDGHGIAGLDDVAQGRAAYRLAQGLAYCGLFIGGDSYVVAVQVV